jgi:hypothetical protein
MACPASGTDQMYQPQLARRFFPPTRVHEDDGSRGLIVPEYELASFGPLLYDQRNHSSHSDGHDDNHDQHICPVSPSLVVVVIYRTGKRSVVLWTDPRLTSPSTRLAKPSRSSIPSFRLQMRHFSIRSIQSWRSYLSARRKRRRPSRDWRRGWRAMMR